MPTPDDPTELEAEVGRELDEADAADVVEQLTVVEGEDEEDELPRTLAEVDPETLEEG